MRRRILSLVLCLCLCFSLWPASALAATENPFTDVKASDWYYDEVLYAYEHDLMHGTSSTTFEPNVTLTRGMVVTILHNLEGNPSVRATSSFEDVPSGAWYEEPVTWAQANGIVNGYSDTAFGSNDNITREQMATILLRYTGFKDYEIVAGTNLSGYTDADQVSSWARDGVAWANATGLIVGTTNTTLSPRDNATRAQAATIFMRYCENVIPEVEPEPTPEKTFKVTFYTVTFETNGGSVIASQNVISGSRATRPTDPSKEGYIFLDWYMDAECTQVFDFNTPINANMTLYSKWGTDEQYSVSFVLFIDEYIQNAEDYSEITVSSGKTIAEPKIPETSVGVFKGWYDSTDLEHEFRFSTPITCDIVLFAKWEFDETDTDNDGLFDELEKEIGTDPTIDDTDGDGLTDGQEVLILGTNPLEQDSDGNGVLDSDEDSDGDGLTNIEEFRLGTSPTGVDSDYDELFDGEEVNTYGTDPLKSDTDGDGADDGWEVRNGFDPNVYNESFSFEVTAESPSASSRVTAGVHTEVYDIAPDTTILVTALNEGDNGLLTPSIAGYLGKAYEFTTNGNFDSATITFRYDTSLGEIGPDFQPRIYYFNESNGTLEELENQVVLDGEVHAQVSHFSTYILLNKVDYEAVWNEEIKAPLTDQSDGQLPVIDVVFVVDVSGSMSGSRMSTAQNALNSFLTALNPGDRAALVKFSDYTATVVELTQDIDRVKESVSGLYAYGGTAIYRGFENGINILSDSSVQYGYKMIVLLTDGHDEPSTNYNDYYADLVTRARTSNITVYAVGVGSDVDTSILSQIATDTSGSYRGTSETSEIIDAFEEIQENTVNLTEDSNNDKIPDYYSDLIRKGELVVSVGSTQFTGIDFDSLPDCDRDGLLNGEELIITKTGDQVVVRMVSDPTNVDSDGDGYDDYEEINTYRTDPLKPNISFNKTDLDYITSDESFISNKYLEFYENDWYGWMERGSVWLGNNFFGSKHDTTFLYKTILMEYLEQAVNESENENKVRAALDTTQTYLNEIALVLDEVAKTATEADLQKISELREQMNVYKSVLSATRRTGNFAGVDVSTIEAIRNSAFDYYVNATKQVKALENRTSFQFLTKAGKVASVAGKVFDVVDVIKAGHDFFKAYSDFEEDLSSMTMCLTVLETIKGSADAPDELRDACSELIREINNQAVNSWSHFWGDVGGKVVHIGVNWAADAGLATIPVVGKYLAAAKVALDLGGALLHISDVSEQCAYLFAISKSASIFSGKFDNSLSSAKQVEPWKIVYNDPGQRVEDYFLLCILRKTSENKMKDADNANSIIIKWLFTKVMYRISDIESNIEKISFIQNKYTSPLFPINAASTSGTGFGGGSSGGGGGGGGSSW